MLLGEDRTKSRDGIGESPLVLTRVVVLFLRARREGGVEKSIINLGFFFFFWKRIDFSESGSLLIEKESQRIY